jgi:hypothetical protein
MISANGRAAGLGIHDWSRIDAGLPVKHGPTFIMPTPSTRLGKSLGHSVLPIIGMSRILPGERPVAPKGVGHGWTSIQADRRRSPPQD